MKENRIKVIISTGQGRLHLIQSAIALKRIGISVTLITGWIPSKIFPDNVIDRMGRFIGRKNSLAAGLRKRTPPEFEQSELKGCGYSEFYMQMLFKLTSFHFFSRSMAAVSGWKLFGRQSRNFIKNSQIFHVRSGAGQGGAIIKARKQGMKILVDHSIAHPFEMERQLAKAATNSLIVSDKFKIIYPNDNFWKLVLKDCLEADCLLVNSEYVKWSFINEGYPEEKIRIAQLGVNSEFNKSKTSYKRSDKLKLIFTGGFGSRKGASLIIDALTLLKADGFSFSFDVVGNVMADIAIPDWIKESKDFKFHGHLSQDKMLPILLDSDVYIFPTYVEGAAQSVKEAMSTGLSIITTRQSGAPIIHGENGLLIEDHNALALYSAIKLLIQDDNLLEAIGRNATKTIRNGHSWNRYAEVVRDVYCELLDDRANHDS